MAIKAIYKCDCGCCDATNDYTSATLSEILAVFAAGHGYVPWYKFAAFLEAMTDAGLLPRDFKLDDGLLLQPYTASYVADFRDMIKDGHVADAYAHDAELIEDFVLWIAQQAIRHMYDN